MGLALPRDRFKAQKGRTQWRSIHTHEADFLNLPFRKCPSCKQIRVSVKELENRVVVLCKNCFLEYVFTKYPAFEDIDYYNKMLDAFREDCRDGRVAPAVVAPPEKIVGECPLCEGGSLFLAQSWRGKRFIKCSNGKCNSFFSLPQKGDFEPARETCEKCGWPLLYWEFRSYGGAFALFCFNRNCGYRSEWKRYRRKKTD
jgi:transcription elongation factor Elf1